MDPCLHGVPSGLIVGCYWCQRPGFVEGRAFTDWFHERLRRRLLPQGVPSCYEKFVDWVKNRYAPTQKNQKTESAVKSEQTTSAASSSTKAEQDPIKPAQLPEIVIDHLASDDAASQVVEKSEEAERGDVKEASKHDVPRYTPEEKGKGEIMQEIARKVQDRVPDELVDTREAQRETSLINAKAPQKEPQTESAASSSDPKEPKPTTPSRKRLKQTPTKKISGAQTKKEARAAALADETLILVFVDVSNPSPGINMIHAEKTLVVRLQGDCTEQIVRQVLAKGSNIVRISVDHSATVEAAAIRLAERRGAHIIAL